MAQLVRAPARKAGFPGSNLVPGENFSFKIDNHCQCFGYLFMYISKVLFVCADRCSAVLETGDYGLFYAFKVASIILKVLFCVCGFSAHVGCDFLPSVYVNFKE